MEETLKAKIRNLLSPSYNLAHIIVKHEDSLNTGFGDLDSLVASEANQSIDSIEKILKLLDNEN